MNPVPAGKDLVTVVLVVRRVVGDQDVRYEPGGALGFGDLMEVPLGVLG